MNREELEALHERDEFLFKLYFTGMRRYMDYKTGIVGSAKRRISLRCLQELMFVSPRRGVAKESTGMPHESKIRRGISQLEKIGLIRTIPNKIYLIFELPLATRDYSVQKQADAILTPLADGEADTVIRTKSISGTRLGEYIAVQPDGEADTPKMAQADTPQLSVTSKEKETLRVSKKKDARRHKLPDDFDVTDKHRELAARNGWPEPSTEIERFRNHHMARGNVMLDWDRAFYTWLENAKRFAPLGGRRGNLEGIKQNSTSRAIDNILNSPTRSR